MTTGNIGGGKGPEQPYAPQQCVDLYSQIMYGKGVKATIEASREVALKTAAKQNATNPILNLIELAIQGPAQGYANALGEQLPQINKSLQDKINLFNDKCGPPPGGSFANAHAESMYGKVYQLGDELRREGITSNAIVTATKEGNGAQPPVRKQGASGLNMPDIGAAVQGVASYAKDHPLQAIGAGVVVGAGAVALLPAGTLATLGTAAAVTAGVVTLGNIGAGPSTNSARQA
jgi:hypothetical protein